MEKKQSQKYCQSLPASILYPKNRAAMRTASTDTDARAITMVSSRWKEWEEPESKQDEDSLTVNLKESTYKTCHCYYNNEKKNVLRIVKHPTSSSPQNLGMAKELISPKQAGHTSISSLAQASLALQQEALTAESDSSFHLAKFSTAKQGQADAVLICYLCLNPVSWYESGLSPLQGFFVVFSRTKISRVCKLGCKYD